MGSGLTYQLLTRDQYVRGRPTVITFRIENTGARESWILTWYTPLEGIRGKIFEVVCNGQTLPYEGRMVKRGDPAADDYLHLAPGGSATADVDLAEVYTLPPCDECAVSFRGTIRDVVYESQLLPRPMDRHEPAEIPGNSVSFRIVE